MTVQPAAQPVSEPDLLALAPELRRVATTRLQNPEAVDDVVQEALARLWEVRWRLDRQCAVAYGIVTVRNLATSEARAEDVQRRHAHRLAEPTSIDSAETAVLASEEHTAMAAALANIPASERRLLIEHEVLGVPTSGAALQEKTTTGAVAARLSRARARLRLEYVLAFRRIELPTPRCRPVLMAISLGDRRRQATLGAGRHLIDCRTCAELADPLGRRSRTLTGLLVLPLLDVWRRAWKWLREHPFASWAAAGAGAAAVTTTLVVAPWQQPIPTSQPAPHAVTSAPSPPAEAPAPIAVPTGPALIVGNETVLPRQTVGPLHAYVGLPAVADRVPVLSVDADEGFWIGWTPEARIWVQLETPTESPVQVSVGQLVSFHTGRIVAHDTAYIDTLVTEAEGAAELMEQGAHISVPLQDLSLS
jgi:RNA polymerase sigma factor (sigma-70 family)